MTSCSYGLDDEAAARQALASDLRILPHVIAGIRSSLFRRHLELNVRTATPLLDIISRSERIDLTAMIERIRPPLSWPRVPLSTNLRSEMLGLEWDFGFEPGAIFRRHRRGGLIARWDGAGGNVLGVRIIKDSIELTVVDGGLMLDTFDGFARLWLESPLPRTLAIAMPGRSISQLVEHRWFSGSDWPVVSVREKRIGATAIIFETGLVTWRLPTATDLEGTIGW
ncbi:hypothetical protein [Sphingomonas sp. BAUL-RG-20F-R05-02]|uniref:hypothetical protein n=1 Tax=Sphingomonas sp. BAUL-RG-20F-R05-02 TaxID=2914830 RepID=UPI001F5AD228|nr:hypothetical protein [Sphingomonas sp. BAUL-RG-20F-R05-02]